MLTKKFLTVEKELNNKYVERKQPIRGLLVGLLAKQHVLLLGPPGTAKSEMTEDLCSRVGGQYFRWLLSRTSAPEELFGPVSLKALENDSYRRVTTGKLPEAGVAFLDEIFKCNSAVLNSLLSVLNERLFFNDGQPAKVPLQFVVGASNELPEDREELGALWDRFLLRYVVSYIRDTKNFEKLLYTQPTQATHITADELAKAQEEIEVVNINKIIPHIILLRKKMQELNIPVSDRRWKQCLNLVQANAWLEDRQDAISEDLEILNASLWQDPGQINQVRQEIMALANPLDQEALDLHDQAMEVYQHAMAVNDEKATSAGTEANAKLKSITKKLQELKAEAINKQKNDTRIVETLAQVADWNREVIQKCLGITV